MPSSFSPWRLPLALIASLAVGTLFLQEAYGPLDDFDIGAGAVAVGLLLGWGLIRKMQAGPIPYRPLSTTRPAITIEPFSRRLRSSFRWTMGFATVYSAYVILVYIVRGSTEFSTRGMSTWTLLLSYWTAALLAGVALAVLLPVARRRWGAFLVGTVIGFIVYGSVAWSLPVVQNVPWWVPVIPGALLGGGLGLVEYDEG